MTLARLPMCANLINAGFSDYSLLDAGCRTKALEPLLKNCNQYFGTDLIAGEGVLQCNLEEKLPFDDSSYDIVTALDVLEHLNNPHEALAELFRIARKAVIISLPNMYYLKFRIDFMLGKGLSGKYRFPPNPVLDRHRWVLSYSESVQFIVENSKQHKVQYSMVLPERGRTKLVSEPIQRLLAKKWPDLFSYGSLFLIELDKDNASTTNSIKA